MCDSDFETQIDRISCPDCDEKPSGDLENLSSGTYKFYCARCGEIYKIKVQVETLVTYFA